MTSSAQIYVNSSKTIAKETSLSGPDVSFISFTDIEGSISLDNVGCVTDSFLNVVRRGKWYRSPIPSD